MRKAFQNFSWGQASFDEKVLKNVEITLPVNDNGEIDYDYIDAFVKAKEKTLIKNAVKWKTKFYIDF